MDVGIVRKSLARNFGMGFSVAVHYCHPVSNNTKSETSGYDYNGQIKMAEHCILRESLRLYARLCGAKLEKHPFAGSVEAVDVKRLLRDIGRPRAS